MTHLLHGVSSPNTGTTNTDDEWVAILCFLSFTIQLIRLSIDLVQSVSVAQTAKDDKADLAATSSSSSSSSSPSKAFLSHSGSNISTTTTSTTAVDPSIGLTNHDVSSTPMTGSSSNSKVTPNYGSVAVVGQDEETPLLASNGIDRSSSLSTTSSSMVWPWTSPLNHRNRFFGAVWTLLALAYGGATWFYGRMQPSLHFPVALLLTSSVVSWLELYMLVCDWQRRRYGIIQRFLHLSATLTVWSIYAVLWIHNHRQYLGTRGATVTNGGVLSTNVDAFLFVGATVNVFIAVLEGWVTARYLAPPTDPNNPAKKKQLSWSATFALVKPYVWPNATDSSAMANRARAIATWLCVILSKVCGLGSPLFLGWASTALAHQDYNACMRNAILYSVISWMGTTLKEGQSLIYLKVSQAAFVQLSETAFGHLHSLSLDWHLRKKLGEVLRSMDRGIAACDVLMKYLFLWLIPAVAECLVVCIIFAAYFKYLPLGITVFYFVFAYVVWTILVTVWRKKFRKALVLHDNEWHDRFTDSLINFETVKFFTADQYEMKRFAEAVSRYQAGSVHVQGSLSILNISQQVLLKTCLAIALSLAAHGIQLRIDCCVIQMGCESGISECCQNISRQVCPGMQVGDFVAVLTYTLNLFAPLNFLGSVYNTIVMAVIDLGNMSELLAESPDVVDAPDAIDLPKKNLSNPDVAVEFDNVYFHYPTQPKERGLKGLSFKMKPGTTTAIVGSTGAGKTTVSRLLFRFYDVDGGAVKINGVDTRSLKQQSLRGAIGVVPQAGSMFNDTIRSNIKYGRQDATDEELVQAAKDAQLLDFIESLDLGWDTLVGDRGLKLSGGEKQRAAIARCLLKNPPFILLDEATASLDTITENSVQLALDRLGADRTVLVIAHRLGTIRNADNIIVLKDGQALEEGTHDELLVKDGLYADMWNMQLHSTSNSSSQVNLESL